MYEALWALKNPERDFPVLQVAGTNGKGSTCAFAAAALSAQGYKVGLYTSPHLVRVNERIRVGNEAISDSMLGTRVLEVLERYPEAKTSPSPLTYFELGTLVALWHFAKEKVDVAVLEVGLGGRLDATTATQPAVTAVTPVSFDHMDYLGHTLAAIAAEKAGIFKPGVPAVVSRQAPEAQETIERIASEVGSPLRLEGRDFFLEPEKGKRPQTYAYRGMRTAVRKLWLGLAGRHQIQNAAVAMACLELLEDRGLSISQESARAGFADVDWPGRLERVEGDPPLLLDGAHNPAGIEALAASLEDLYPRHAVHLVFGVLADKDHRPMLRALFPRCRSVHLTPLDSPRTLLPQRYLSEARALCPAAFVHADVGEALAAAKEAARQSTKGLVLCCGSLFLVGAVKRLPLPWGEGRMARCTIGS
ncbi:MAG: bifunctional folylpolyglutamate synthase/dihydrofolate synthase [Myxococcota bacterium]